VTSLGACRAGYVNSVAFSLDGKQVVSGSDDKTVRLWDVATGRQVLPPLEDHISSVSSVAFSPDGKQVVSGSDDKILPRTIVVSNDWVMEGDVNILWLPSEYRTEITAISGGFVVLAQNSGRISFFKFTQASKVL
jgi:WD40 repeat protein